MIEMGASREEKLTVTEEVAISFLGLSDARVLSTPHLIGFMERTARNLIKDMLAEGYDTVGTHVDVKHLAAAPLGTEVTFFAKLVGMEDRRAQFDVAAWDAHEKLGEGRHERFIVNVERFAEKMRKKRG